MPDGTPSVNFNLACSRYAGKEEGTGKSRYSTTWIPCQWIDRRAETLIEKLVKGRWLVVQGHLVTYHTDRMKTDGQPARMIVEVDEITFPPEPKQV